MGHFPTVCFFNTTRAWGGGEKWHFEAAAYFHRQGFPVLLVAHADGELAKRASAEGLPCRHIRLGNLSFLDPLLLWQLRRLFRQAQVGTVFLNLSSDLKAAGLAAKWAGVPHIIYRRGLAKAVKGSWLNRLLLGRVVSHIMANSEETKRLLLQHLHASVPAGKIQVIYNGLDFSTYEDQSAGAARWREQWPPHTPVIGNLGRLTPQKGQTHLIDMAKILRSRGCRFLLAIAGTGELEQALQAQIDEAGLADCVRLVGFAAQPGAFLASVDIFVLGSLWEGFGYVLAEAGYYGKPVVAFDCSSNPEVVVPGKTGFLVPEADATALADRVEQLLRHPEQAAAMGQAGREHVLATFPLQRCMEQTQGLFFRPNA